MPAMAIMRYNIETIGVSILKGGLGMCLLPCCLLGNVQDDLVKRGLALSSTMYVFKLAMFDCNQYDDAIQLLQSIIF